MCAWARCRSNQRRNSRRSKQWDSRHTRRETEALALNRTGPPIHRSASWNAVRARHCAISLARFASLRTYGNITSRATTQGVGARYSQRKLCLYESGSGIAPAERRRNPFAPLLWRGRTAKRPSQRNPSATDRTPQRRSPPRGPSPPADPANHLPTVGWTGKPLRSCPAATRS